MVVWCGAGWGGVGHVDVRANLLRFLMLRWWWGGVGHVNVRVNLLRFLMLRWWWGGVGWGMLTFVWTCWGSWCYADDGVGWGGVGHGRPAKKSCQRVCMPGVRTWFFIARCGNGDSLSTRTKTWRKPRFPNCKRCKNDGVHSWACLNLYWSKNCVFPRRNTHLSKKTPNSDVWISQFLWSLNCVFA